MSMPLNIFHEKKFSNLNLSTRPEQNTSSGNLQLHLLFTSTGNYSTSSVLTPTPGTVILLAAVVFVICV